MRRLTFFLCLLMVVVLRWTIVSAAARTTTGRNEAVLPKTDLTLEAVNTGFKASLVAVGIRAEGPVWITHELLSAGIDARAHSTTAILSRSKSTIGIRIHRDHGGHGDRNLPPTSDRAYRPRRIYL